MKHKLLTLFLALAASVGTMFAWDYEQVLIGDLYYNLDATKKEAQVTLDTSAQYGENYKDSKTVVIPESVLYNSEPYTITNIGDYAFYLCSNLTSVTIPNSVTNIGNSAFSGCSSLTSVAIPNSVTSIGNSAFASVPNINYSGTAIGSPWGARSVNGYVDGFLVYSDNTKTNLLLCFAAAIGEITIPSSVTIIGDYAFYQCSNLTSVTIPNNVTSIGEGAFVGCSSLTSVAIPNSVTSIGNSAFASVPNINYSGTAIGSPWGARSVNGYVDGFLVYSDNTKTNLLLCSAAATGAIEIPNSVTSIGWGAFSGCSGLTSPVYNEHVFAFMPTSYSGGYTIPDGIELIAGSAFSACSGLTSVTIPNSVTYLGDEAFRNCSGLTSVTIPNSVTHIGNYAFRNCSGLTSVTIGNGVTSIGYYAFRNCSSLTSVILKSNTLVDKTYSSDSNLKSIFGIQVTEYIIGDNVTSIGGYAFSGCSSLTSVTIGSSVTSIGLEAFSDCSNLRIVTWNAKNCANSGNFGSQVTSFTFGDEVESIPASCCSSMNKLTSVDIPNSVTSIGWGAFSGCSGLTSPVYNEHVFAFMPTSYSGGYTIPDGIELIAGSAFSACSGLTSVTIPNSVTYLGDEAFRNCSGLTSVTIPNSVTHIGNYAFRNCSGLTSIEIPNSVTSIGSGAFAYCSGLTSIEIPNSVTSIGSGAFAYCSGLTSIEIPNSVTSIGSWAFEGCTSLTLITIGQDVPIANYWRICGTIDGKNVHNHPNLTQVQAPAWFFDVEENNWSYCPKYMTNIKVNAGTLTDNAFSVIKRNYKTLKTLDISNVENTTLADEAFKDNYNLTELILPASLTSVSYMAVAGCVSLKQIDIPASVEEIDNRAFEDCRSIETITFGGKQPSSKPGLRFAPATTESQLRRIGNWAFYNAHELQHLEIPEGVTEIGDGAFYGCTYLQDLSLPKTIQRIGDNCFALCSHLERIDVEALTPPTIFARTFFDVSRKIPVYVPEDVMLDYLNDPYWKEMNIQGAPTGIDEIIEQNDGVKKVLQDGQILIVRGEKTYTLTGIEVK